MKRYRLEFSFDLPKHWRLETHQRNQLVICVFSAHISEFDNSAGFNDDQSIRIYEMFLN